MAVIKVDELDERDFYQKLREDIRVWAEDEGRDHKWIRWVMLAPDLFHLLIRLGADPEVELAEKAKLAAVVVYFISPLDLLPELFLGPSGFLEDIVLSTYVLNAMINRTDVGLLRKHWAGDEDILEIIQTVLVNADRMIGSGLFKKLKKLLKN